MEELLPSLKGILKEAIEEINSIRIKEKSTEEIIIHLRNANNILNKIRYIDERIEYLRGSTKLQQQLIHLADNMDSLDSRISNSISARWLTMEIKKTIIYLLAD